MSNCKKVIGIGTLSVRNLNPFIAAIFYVTRNYALILINDQKYEQYKFKESPLFFSLIMFLGETAIGILELFSIDWITKTHPSSTTQTIGKQIKTPFAFLQPEKESKKPLYLIIVGLSIIEAICYYGLNILNYFFENANNLQIEIRGFKLIFDSVLCYFFLHYAVFRHHYLSIATLIIGITLMTAQEIITEKFEIYLPFIFFGHSLLLSIRDCLEKAIMENKFIGAVRILFFRGVFGFTLIAMILLIIQLIPCSSDAILCEDIFKIIPYIFKDWLPLYFTIYFFSGMLYNLFSTLTKKDFNPAFMAVADYFAAILWMIVSIFYFEIKAEYSIIYIVTGYILITIGCFVYNELIILYFCNLHWNTKKEITKRGNEDALRCSGLIEN